MRVPAIASFIVCLQACGHDDTLVCDFQSDHAVSDEQAVAGTTPAGVIDQLGTRIVDTVFDSTYLVPAFEHATLTWSRGEGDALAGRATCDGVDALAVPALMTFASDDGGFQFEYSSSVVAISAGDAGLTAGVGLDADTTILAVPDEFESYADAAAGGGFDPESATGTVVVDDSQNLLIPNVRFQYTTDVGEIIPVVQFGLQFQ